MADVVFNNLLCQTAITQTSCNQEQNPIEAVNTCPLATQEELLDAAAHIGERSLRSQVVMRG